MKTFVFAHKHSSAVIILSAADYECAEIKLIELVSHPQGWRCENEEGENEE